MLTDESQVEQTRKDKGGVRDYSDLEVFDKQPQNCVGREGMRQIEEGFGAEAGR